MTSYRAYPPLDPEHPMVRDRWPCAVCGVPLQAGDLITLAFGKPVPGDRWVVQKWPIHWNHREAARP